MPLMELAMSPKELTMPLTELAMSLLTNKRSSSRVRGRSGSATAPEIPSEMLGFRSISLAHCRLHGGFQAVEEV